MAKKISNWQKSIIYIYNKLPMFTKVEVFNEYGYNPNRTMDKDFRGSTRVWIVDDHIRLYNPEDKFKHYTSSIIPTEFWRIIKFLFRENKDIKKKYNSGERFDSHLKKIEDNDNGFRLTVLFKDDYKSSDDMFTLAQKYAKRKRNEM